MWLGRTIACFDVNFNRATTEDAAFYFADKEQLKKAISESMDDDAENGKAMKEIADRRYTWDRIATDYAQIVQDAL
jgi:glycosyltransferase involved in cell wall biosynthesis